MTTYVFEAKDGHIVEREFRMGEAPSYIYVKDKAGKRVKHKRVICAPVLRIPVWMRASGDDDQRIAHEEFHRPNPNFGNRSAADLVKAGEAKTRECSRWI